MFMKNIKKIFAKNLANLISRFFTLSSAVCKSPKARKAWIANFVDFFVFWACFLLQNSLNFFIRFINHINLFGISRHFCYFKVRGSHACHGIYFVFHGNTRDTRVLPWNTKYIPWHTQYAWDWVKCSEKSHCHVVQIGFFDWTIWIWGIIYIYIYIQNLQTSHGYIFCTFLHFATIICNFTCFKMLALAAVKDLPRSKFILLPANCTLLHSRFHPTKQFKIYVRLC